MQTALAEAGFKPDEQDGPPGRDAGSLRGFMDELARMVSSPFDVIQSLQNSGAMLPAQLRGFMAIEFALSPHQILRDTVPLMLLDDDPAVRTSAVGALDQTARPETHVAGRAAARHHPAQLDPRRGTGPPWMPPSARHGLPGVEIGAWPAPRPDLEFHASTIDGSGAQSILAIKPSPARKACWAGVLLRHGTGVVDSWADQDLTRGKINKLLRETQNSAPFARVNKPFVDTMVQHAIGTAAELDTVPAPTLLEIAELFGGTEWKDRRLDIAAEAERLFDALDPDDRTPVGIEAGFERGLEWMAKDEVFSTWFEDGPHGAEGAGKSAAHRPRRHDRPGDDRHPAGETRGLGRTVPDDGDVVPGRRPMRSSATRRGIWCWWRMP